MLSETIISAEGRLHFRQYLKDLWIYRDLFYALAERDIKVRYKQAVFGVLWAIIPPLVNSIIFYIIFTRVVQIPTQELPPILFFLAAMIPWTCFSNGITQATASLEGSSGLISKVYFPRLIVPSAAIVTSILDFSIGWVFFNFIAIGCGYWTISFIPFTIILLGLQLSITIGMGAILAALNAQYRDIRFVVPFLVQIGMWITPVVWPMQRLLETRLGDSLKIFLYLNPMAGVIESYRALLAGDYIPYKLLTFNWIVAVGILIGGFYFFKKREQRIVDLL